MKKKQQRPDSLSMACGKSYRFCEMGGEIWKSSIKGKAIKDAADDSLRKKVSEISL